jgi:FixJ family two-component response regulator
MPDLSGTDVIQFLITKKSPAKLVLMTGFDTDVLSNAQAMALAGGLNFVSGFRKPFRFDELRTLLNDMKSVLQQGA